MLGVDPMIQAAVLDALLTAAAAIVSLILAVAAWGLVRFVKHVDALGAQLSRVTDDVGRLTVRIGAIEAAGRWREARDPC